MHSKTETIVYRLVQEALTNVRKHASATSCEVTLQLDAGSLVLEVRDNGRGFDTSDPLRFVDERHFGLSAMRERVEIAGGTWTLNSHPGKGTVIHARVPAAPLAARLAVA
jgi:signal transduction histidine kinase